MHIRRGMLEVSADNNLCAVLLYALAISRHNFMKSERRQRITLYVQNVQDDPHTWHLWNIVCNSFLKCKKLESCWHLSASMWSVWGTRHERVSGPAMVRNCNNGHENVYDDTRAGRPSVVNEDLIHAEEEKVGEDGRFTISSLFLYLPHFSLSALHTAASDWLDYQKFLTAATDAQWGTENTTGRHCTDISGMIRWAKWWLLCCILTGDQTWLPHITPESSVPASAKKSLVAGISMTTTRSKNMHHRQQHFTT